MTTDIAHQRVFVNGVNIHLASAGPADGPLVLLLHGFPARWSTWRSQLTALGGAGFLAIAPDLRGYGESDKPAGMASYSVLRVAEDLEGIVHALGRERASVAGHDFGGGVAWAAAMFHKGWVERVATLNAVHPVGFQKRLLHASQIKKSWYAIFFLLPSIPEWYLERGDYAYLKSALEGDGLDPDTVADLLEGIRPPGALHAALDWYRQSFREAVKNLKKCKRVDVPVLCIWGDRERHMDAELASPPAGWASDVRVVHVPNGSHWVHLDAPERVNELLIDHFVAAQRP